MVFPDFQRDFVWEPNATRELIVSIANNNPAGNPLGVRDAKRAFAPQEFEGAPKIGGKSHTFLVLDGQQRMGECGWPDTAAIIRNERTRIGREKMRDRADS